MLSVLGCPLISGRLFRGFMLSVGFFLSLPGRGALLLFFRFMLSVGRFFRCASLIFLRLVQSVLIYGTRLLCFAGMLRRIGSGDRDPENPQYYCECDGQHSPRRKLRRKVHTPSWLRTVVSS
jgi:hypothetical protein